MPNWAFGKVEVTGTRKGVKSFIERFISNDDPSTVPGKRFFARSFMNEKRQACPTHQASVRERGLTQDEIEQLGYRTTPTTRLKRIVTELL